MPYTREEFLDAGIDPDSREAYEINQAAYEEEARAADPTYGTVGQHSGPREYLQSATQIFDPRKSALPYLLPYASLLSGPATTGSLLTGEALGSGAGQGALEASPYVLGNALPAATTPAVTPLLAAGAPTATGLIPKGSPEPTPGTLAPPPPAAAPPPEWQGPLEPGSQSPPRTPFNQTKAGMLLGLLTPALLGTWTDRRAADTARDAAAIQRQATDRALGINEQVYRDAQGNLAPYTNLGSQSANTLAGLMGFTPLPPSAAGGTAATAPAPAPAVQSNYPRSAAGKPIIGQAQPRTLSELTRPAQQQASQETALARTQSSQPQSSQPGLVRMRAPHGKIVMVPADRVAEAQRQGGMVV